MSNETDIVCSRWQLAITNLVDKIFELPRQAGIPKLL